MPWPKSVPLLLALGLSGLGCGKVRDVRLCRGVARDINLAMDQIEALSKAKPLNELRIADRYAELAKTLTPRSVGDQPLAVALRDYVVVLRATETAVRTHDTLQKTQSSRIGEPRRELERLVKRERAASTRIEVACH
jgi:hypothetical protein